MKKEILSFTTYVKVNRDFGAEIQVTDLDTGKDYNVTGSELIKSFYSADKFEKEEKLTKTALAEKFISVNHLPFTVEFEKADGSLRKLRGRLVSSESALGRSQVLDLDVDKDPNKSYDTRMRLVDHRTISSLIVDNVKYSLKK